MGILEWLGEIMTVITFAEAGETKIAIEMLNQQSEESNTEKIYTLSA